MGCNLSVPVWFKELCIFPGLTLILLLHLILPHLEQVKNPYKYSYLVTSDLDFTFIKQYRNWLKDWLKNCSPQDPGVKDPLLLVNLELKCPEVCRCQGGRISDRPLPRRLPPRFWSLAVGAPDHVAGGGVEGEGGAISTHSESELRVCGPR